MLGWEILVLRHANARLNGDSDSGETLASWTTSVGGTNWLEQLVASGRAVSLPGNGYPNIYLISATAFLAVVKRGVPKSDGPPVLGDDYFQPAGWTADQRLGLYALQQLDPEELLVVEAWDRS